MPTRNLNLLTITIVLLTFMSCSVNERHTTESKDLTKTVAIDTTYQVKVIVSGNGWGYQITQNKTSIINQYTIPAVNGTHSFVSEAEAEEVGLLVVHKLSRGLFPPSVTIKELDSLRITY